MNNNLVVHTDPFRIHLNEIKSQVSADKTIWEIVSDLDLIEPKDGELLRKIPFVVIVNTEYVLQKDWNTVPESGSLIQVVYLPKGGGGSNIGTILGAVLIAVMAYFTMGLSLVAAGAVGVGAYVGLTVLGNMVPKPTGGPSANDRDRASPTYSLGAQSNSPRMLEAIPRIYGRMRTFPDFASQPYTEYQGNSQFLYQLFSVSIGQIAVKDIFIDDVNINEFEDAKFQIINPGQAVTLFPDNVITSNSVQNLIMYGPNDPAFAILGPFNTSPSGTKVNAIGIDVCLPQGMRRVNNETGANESYSVDIKFDYRLIDDNGNSLGEWTTLVEDMLSFATPTAQFKSYKVDMPEGRYQVRGLRLSNQANEDTVVELVQWLNLRGYVQSTFVYPNVTLIAVTMKATNVLNSTTARKFSVVSVGMVQPWDAENGWGAYIESGNPAWIAADAIRNPIYGRGLLTERFNIYELARLAAVWETRGDTFNGTFDTTTQFWDALSKILRVGRATPIYYAGVIDFVRDEVKVIPESMFQPSNMVAGSFKAVYNFFDSDTPDHVIVEYVDGTTWEPDTVSCKLPGETALKPYNIQLFGCTDRDQAWREGMSMVAANRDRRRTITFMTHTAGYVPYFNSLTRIAHDVPQWGYFGRIISLDKVTGVFTSSEPIPFDDNIPFVLAFRRKDGRGDGPYTIVPDASIDPLNNEYGGRIVASAAQLNDIYISDGLRSDYTYYQCGPVERQGMLALVTSAVPTNDGQVAITCINYADSVHSAETGGIVPPPPPESNLPGIPNAPIVSAVQVLYTVEVGVQNIVATPAAGAIYYEFQARMTGAPDWTSLGTNSEPTLTVNLAPGNWSVRVRAFGRSPGPWATWTGDIAATSLPTCKLDVFVATSELFAIGLTWAFEANTTTIAGKIEVYASGTNIIGNSVKLFELPYPANKFIHTDLGAGQRVFYWARVIDTAGRIGPWYNNGVAVTGLASADAGLILDYLVDQITKTQLSQELWEEIELAGDLGPVYAAIEEERTARVSADGVLTNITTTQGTAIGNNSAAVQQVSQTQQDTNGKLSAMWAVKVQATQDGKKYLAGIGVGIENNGDTSVESQIILAANRVAIIDPAGGVSSLKAPFVVTGGQVIMNVAIIGDGTIENAKIGNTIQSNSLGANNQPRWKLDKNGTLVMNGPSTGSGYLTITDSLVSVYDGNGTLRVRLGIWA